MTQNLQKIDKGATVSFVAHRAERKIVGTVTKVNRKTVIVHEEGYGNWKVPNSLILEHVV